MIKLYLFFVLNATHIRDIQSHEFLLLIANEFFQFSYMYIIIQLYSHYVNIKAVKLNTLIYLDACKALS